MSELPEGLRQRVLDAIPAEQQRIIERQFAELERLRAALDAIREIADRFDGYNGDDMAVEGRWRENDRLEHFASLRREKEEAQREGLRLVGLLRERDDTLAAVREWAEKASAGYDAGNYNVTSTPQQNCGLALLHLLNRSDTDE